MHDPVDGLMYRLGTACQWRSIPKNLLLRGTMDLVRRFRRLLSSAQDSVLGRGGG